MRNNLERTGVVLDSTKLSWLIIVDETPINEQFCWLADIKDSNTGINKKIELLQKSIKDFPSLKSDGKPDLDTIMSKASQYIIPYERPWMIILELDEKVYFTRSTKLINLKTLTKIRKELEK